MSGWPDKPGVPLNPEQDSEGHVWRDDSGVDVFRWVAAHQWYEDRKGRWFTPAQALEDGDTYLGRIVTPAEVAAREAAAAAEMRDGAVEMANACGEPAVALEIASLPHPHDDALARVRAEAWREGMEAGHRDALRWAVALQQIQQAAAAALKRAPDSELFALLHRTAASALASDAEPTNEAAIRARMEADQ